MKNIVWCFILFLSCNFPDLGLQVKVEEIISDNSDNKIYLKKEARGLNYSVSALSCSSIIDFENSRTNEDYIFYTFLPVFYKISNDTIFIYTDTKSKVPHKFSSEITVEQIEMSFEELNELEANNKYMKHDLSIFY